MVPSDAFFAGTRFAIFGTRARGRVQGPVLIAALARAGKRAVAIEPDGAEVKNAEPAASLAAAGAVDGAVLLPPAPWDADAQAFTEDAVRQCREAGVRSLWIYTAGDAAPALKVAVDLGMDPVGSVCPCLYVQGAGFPHNLHRWLLKVTKQL